MTLVIENQENNSPKGLNWQWNLFIAIRGQMYPKDFKVPEAMVDLRR